MIETYLTALNAALQGPRRAKADLLAEAHDHLVDTKEAYEQAGLSQQAAEQSAINDFGQVEEIAPAYQSELNLAQGHRTAAAALTLAAAQPVVWATFARLYDNPTHHQLADTIVENIGGAVILLSLLAVLSYRYALRRPTIREKLARATGFGALGVSATLATASLTLTALTGGYVTLLWTVAFVLTPAAWVTRSARRCLLSRPQHPIN